MLDHVKTMEFQYELYGKDIQNLQRRLVEGDLKSLTGESYEQLAARTKETIRNIKARRLEIAAELGKRAMFKDLIK